MALKLNNRNTCLIAIKTYNTLHLKVFDIIYFVKHVLQNSIAGRVATKIGLKTLLLFYFDLVGKLVYVYTKREFTCIFFRVTCRLSLQKNYFYNQLQNLYFMLI